MKSRRWLWGGIGVAGAAGAIGGAWILSLPPAHDFSPPPLGPSETQALVEGLRPPKRQRPLVAAVGINDATEATDYLMPYGILRRADVADVLLLSTQQGPVTLFPALTVQPHATIAEFDARHPEGADYVIVPAMSRDDDPEVMTWLKSQAGKGALIVGVCAGAKVVGEAGLLDGKRATTHWYYVKELLTKHPAIHYVADRREHEQRWCTALEESPLPATFVWGDLDPVSGAHMIERVEARIPAARVIRLADVGHWPLLEAPDVVAAAIDDALASA